MKRTHPSSERGLSSTSTAQRRTNKKTRFVSPDEDSARFAEDVDAQLEDSRSATRRGRVKTDGYESDSSDDGEGVVLSRWKGEAGGGGGGGGDDDDDMFAMGDKEGAGRAEGVPGKNNNKSKEEAYLRLGDIEGQEFNEASGSGREEEEEESALSADEPEDEDEDAAARRRKAGMGFALSAFHMREEMEEGKFTADGGFVRTYDPHAVHDRWLDGTDERAMRRAARAKRAQDRAERGKMRAEAREAAQRQTGKKADMEKQMLAVLRKGETVLEALARLGAKAKKAKGTEKSAKKLTRPHAHNMDVDGATAHPEPARAPAPPKPSAQTSQIEHLTSLASSLMALGDADIYSKTYEHLLRAVRAAGDVEPDWTPPSVAYEYRWDVPEARGAEAQVFGPFGEDEMKAWYGARYFGLAGEKVKVRASGGDWGSWDDVVD